VTSVAPALAQLSFSSVRKSCSPCPIRRTRRCAHPGGPLSTAYPVLASLVLQQTALLLLGSVHLATTCSDRRRADLSSKSGRVHIAQSRLDVTSAPAAQKADDACRPFPRAPAAGLYGGARLKFVVLPSFCSSSGQGSPPGEGTRLMQRGAVPVTNSRRAATWEAAYRCARQAVRRGIARRSCRCRPLCRCICGSCAVGPDEPVSSCRHTLRAPSRTPDVVLPAAL